MLISRRVPAVVSLRFISIQCGSSKLALASQQDSILMGFFFFGKLLSKHTKHVPENKKSLNRNDVQNRCKITNLANIVTKPNKDVIK